jgi:hypothetical protein
MADSYLLRLHRRAWRDTLATHSIKRIVITGLIASASALIWRYVDPDRATLAAKTAVVTALAAFLVYPVVYIVEFLSAPAKLSAEDRAEREALAEELAKAKADLPRLTILHIEFDPNGPTEMYVDFDIANPGPPTTIDDWKLDVTFPDGRKSGSLYPRFIMGGKQFRDAFDALKHSDLTEAPLETGERRRWCRLGFTVQGNARERFRVTGAEFEISASDVRENRITTSCVLVS